MSRKLKEQPFKLQGIDSNAVQVDDHTCIDISGYTIRLFAGKSL